METIASLSRRSFLGLAATGTIAAGAGLTGCAPSTDQSETPSSGNTQNQSEYTPGEIAETIDVDVIVAGLGMSGLAAAVQSALHGDRVIGIEAMPQTGGNGTGVEGIFAVGSTMALDAGFDVQPADVVRTELMETQWVADGVTWKNLVQTSADNVEWLIEQGVEFSGVVDDYLGFSQVPGFHWFQGGLASIGYVPQMTARAEELGVEIRTNTACKQVIMENGEAVGVYAQGEDGRDIRINALAVILATGGYGNNQKYIEQRGFNWDNFQYGGTPGHDGDGLEMALEVGARNFVSSSTFNATNTIGTAFDFKGIFMQRFGGGGNQLWVNQDADRFISEDFAATNFELQSVPAMTQNTMYTVFDRTILETTLADNPDVLAEVDSASEPDLAIADTLEEAAEQLGLNPTTLRTTVDQYNDLCNLGEDTDFGKSAQLIIPIENPPFYIGKLSQYYLVAIGGIECDINGQCLGAGKQPIPGLYAVGTDGCMLYRNIYPINIGGTCNANNINSGRMAADHAHSTYVV